MRKGCGGVQDKVSFKKVVTRKGVRPMECSMSTCLPVTSTQCISTVECNGGNKPWKEKLIACWWEEQVVKNEENILIKRRRVMDARKTMRSDVSTNVSWGGGGGGGIVLHPWHGFFWWVHFSCFKPLKNLASDLSIHERTVHGVMLNKCKQQQRLFVFVCALLSWIVADVSSTGKT